MKVSRAGMVVAVSASAAIGLLAGGQVTPVQAQSANDGYGYGIYQQQGPCAGIQCALERNGYNRFTPTAQVHVTGVEEDEVECVGTPGHVVDFRPVEGGAVVTCVAGW